MAEQKPDQRPATKEEKIDHINKEINRLMELRDKVLKE